MENDIIEGEVAHQLPSEAEQPGQASYAAPAPINAANHPVHAPNGPSHALANPLDVDPAQFVKALEQRSTNFDALREHLRGQLVPGKDFGKIHVVKDCDNHKKPWLHKDCPAFHFSPYTLFNPGVDKIINFLGLRDTYDETEDYRRASLKGIQIKDVFAKCYIVDAHNRVMAESSASANISEHNGSLHNTILKAQKRARANAAKRLPVIANLFEDDMLADLAASNKKNTYDERAATVKPGSQYNTGATLETVPFGKHEGKKFHELTDAMLNWGLNNWADKPDLQRACKVELDRRAQEREANQREPLTDTPPDLEPQDNHPAPSFESVQAQAQQAALQNKTADGPPADAYF